MYVIPSIFWEYTSFVVFISWLPFEAIKLIDTFTKTENYQRNQLVNKNNNNNNNNNSNNGGLETGEVRDGANNINTKKSESKSKAEEKKKQKAKNQVQLQPRQPVVPKFKNNSKMVRLSPHCKLPLKHIDEFTYCLMASK